MLQQLKAKYNRWRRKTSSDTQVDLTRLLATLASEETASPNRRMDLAIELQKILYREGVLRY